MIIDPVNDPNSLDSDKKVVGQVLDFVSLTRHLQTAYLIIYLLILEINQNSDFIHF